MRAGGEAPLFDQLFAGMNLNSTTAGYGAIGTVVNGVVQTGSLHLRRRFATDLAEGDYITIASFINENTGGNPTSGLWLSIRRSAMSAAESYEMAAIGQTVVGPAIPAPLRCFPENYPDGIQHCRRQPMPVDRDRGFNGANPPPECDAGQTRNARAEDHRRTGIMESEWQFEQNRQDHRKQADPDPLRRHECPEPSESRPREYSINDADFGTIAAKGNQSRNFQSQLRLLF
ncbi:MAG: hypothetical protein HY646_18780 [Acidobacteria bacterium]|nr:hypothetical protein [Acidobacteriota bacterium]